MILRAAGTNCEHETAWAFELAGARPEIRHVNTALARPQDLDDCQILAIPGGFSYGDDIASGRVFANQIRLRLRDSVERLVERGGLVLGICNGFQVLVKSGLLGQGQVTLTHNTSGLYLDRWVRLRAAASTPCAFLSPGQTLELPIAHAEGRFVMQDGVADTLSATGQLALCYDNDNPNGSQSDVAGMCDPTGRIFGLMPHPERFLRFENHPRWTRMPRPEDGSGEGLTLFRNAVASLEGSLK